MIHSSDGMSKKCNSKSLFFFVFFSQAFAPYFRMSEYPMEFSSFTAKNPLYFAWPSFRYETP